MRTCRALICLITTAGSLLFASTSVARDEVPTRPMIGSWKGNARVIVSWCSQTNLPIEIVIDPTGTVTGTIGDASLANARISLNRGWLGKKLNVKTDYIISGELRGPIIASEKIQRSGVNIPLNFENGAFTGGLHTTGAKFGGKERMILSATVKLGRARPASQGPDH